MEIIGVSQVRTRWSELLRRIGKGERITITKHGHPVAMLIPAQAAGQPDRKQAIEAMKQFRKGRKLGDLSIREMIEEGRQQ